jgi:predicted secreted hydrolase
VYRVWLGNWEVLQTGTKTYHLEAAEGDFRIALDLEDSKGPVLEGDQGLSQKGSDPGNASYYISQTRLASRGSVTVGGNSYDVSGSTWMDHEFSTSALGGDQVGWDWFALQLDDGSELMLFTIRDSKGNVDTSSGAWIDPGGSLHKLEKADFRIQVLNTWKSPHSGAVYPIEWSVEIPSLEISLNVKPRLTDQELRVSYTYWEGAVTASGRHAGRAVSAVGYVEMTGYAQSMRGNF